MSKKAPLVLGLAAAGGVGYYFYSAGGNPQAAEKKFESDIHKAAAEAKNRLPGRTPDAQNDLKHIGAQAGAKVDSAVAEADRQAGRAKSNIEAYAKDAKAEALKAADKFDSSVQEGTAKAKGGLSSWFSSGNK